MKCWQATGLFFFVQLWQGVSHVYALICINRGITTCGLEFRASSCVYCSHYTLACIISLALTHTWTHTHTQLPLCFQWILGELVIVCFLPSPLSWVDPSAVELCDARPASLTLQAERYPPVWNFTTKQLRRVYFWNRKMTQWWVTRVQRMLQILICCWPRTARWL